MFRGSVEAFRFSRLSVAWLAFFCAGLCARAEDCVPAGLLRKFEDEKTIDAAQAALGRTSGPLDRESLAPRKGPVAIREGVLRTAVAPVDAELLKARLDLPQKLLPLRGFRATLAGIEKWPLALSKDATAGERDAEAFIRSRLACDGLLSVGVTVARRLGMTEASAVETLRRVGYPVDLLDHFAHPSGVPVLKLILSGDEGEVKKAEFRWRVSARGFAAASENGEQSIRAARVQIRGDYNDGVVPGSGFDIAGHLVAALSDARFVMNVQQMWFEAARYQAIGTWRLRKRNHVTLIAEPMDIGGWAQDNGKGGAIGITPAILAPRFASINNEESEFWPADSYSLEGLRIAGVQTVQSPLLFQGGNTIVARDPQTRQRVLLVSEVEIWRNVRLGLSREQSMEAFRLEFGVDLVVVIPLASYHLDYDVTCRVAGGKVIALINDPLALARRIVKLVETDLEESGLKGVPLDASDSRIALLFRTDGIDSPSVNLMVYRVAQDWLKAADGQAGEYHDALRRQLAGLAEQRFVLEGLGWEVMAIPSMTSLRVGINYLNGIHDQRRFLMPAYGGYYARLDVVAAKEISCALGDVEVTSIACPQLQTHLGGLHCVLSVFPGNVELR